MSWDGAGRPGKPRQLEFTAQNARQEIAAQESFGAHMGLGIVPVPVRLEILIIHVAVEFLEGFTSVVTSQRRPSE